MVWSDGLTFATVRAQHFKGQRTIHLQSELSLSLKNWYTTATHYKHNQCSYFIWSLSLLKFTRFLGSVVPAHLWLPDRSETWLPDSDPETKDGIKEVKEVTALFISEIWYLDQHRPVDRDQCRFIKKCIYHLLQKPCNLRANDDQAIKFEILTNERYSLHLLHAHYWVLVACNTVSPFWALSANHNGGFNWIYIISNDRWDFLFWL